MIRSVRQYQRPSYYQRAKNGHDYPQDKPEFSDIVRIYKYLRQENNTHIADRWLVGFVGLHIPLMLVPGLIFILCKLIGN